MAATQTHTRHTYHGGHCAQGPAYTPVWGQPQPSPGLGSSSADIDLTLALTGPSGAALLPAAREAIQHAVAQTVSGIGAPTPLQMVHACGPTPSEPVFCTSPGSILLVSCAHANSGLVQVMSACQR